MNIYDIIIAHKTSGVNCSLSQGWMKLLNYKIWLLAVMVFTMLMPAISWAACSWVGNTGTVASPYGSSDISACITDASPKTGDVTILIPDCSASSVSVSVNMKSGFANVTGLTIRGQNDCNLDGNGRPTACGTNINNLYVNYMGMRGKSFRLAHLRMTGTSGLRIDGSSKSWRLDHLYMDTVTGYTSSRIIWLTKSVATDLTEGVIDHNNIRNWAWGTIIHYQPGADGGNYEWMMGPQLGTSNAIYFENNTIYSAGGGYYITDNNGPSRWVFRYNDITNAYIAGHDAQVGGFRGALKLEAYNNTFTYNASGNCYVMYRSGATGVFYNNTITSSGSGGLCSPSLAFANYRSTGPAGWPSACSNASGKMWLATTSNYPGSCSSGTGCINIDGSASGGYPCRDQVGAGGNDPQVGGGQPYLLWNNRINGSDASGSVGAVVGGQHIVANRDYCTTSTTMPASCNGVVTNYTAYVYPHPLTTGTAIVKPSAPILF